MYIQAVLTMTSTSLDFSSWKTLWTSSFFKRSHSKNVTSCLPLRKKKCKLQKVSEKALKNTYLKGGYVAKQNCFSYNYKKPKDRNHLCLIIKKNIKRHLFYFNIFCLVCE